MATNIINVANASLPRSLDVSISVSKPQAEQTTDLSVSVFVQQGGSFDFGAGRIAYYLDYDSVAADARVTAEGKAAAQAFFAQSPRALRLAIAQAFTTAQKGYMRTGALGALSAFQAVTSGSFAVSIDGVSANIAALNFTADTTLAQVATRIQTALQAVGTGGFTAATAVIESGTLRITSGTSGALSQVSVLAAVTPASGTDISGPTHLNGRAGVALTQVGYTPTGLVGELDLIAQAAEASGRFVYGWALDRVYRDTTDQTDAAEWAQARRAIMPLVSNSPLAWDPSSTTDLGPTVLDAGLYRAWPIYHDDVAAYPDTALLAIILSVNYSLKLSTITAKFKDLVGVPLVSLTTTQWQVLESKGYNTLTQTGNTSRVFREGTTGNPSWFADDVVNLDNFAEQLQVALYNVFLRNGKVPYNTVGQAMLQDAITEVCERFTFNGSFSDRRVLDLTKVPGFRIEPPYTITPAPIELQSASDRAARIGPPFRVDVNLAGAIHSIAVAVNAYS